MLQCINRSVGFSPNCICFSSCSLAPIAFVSAAAPRLHSLQLLLPDQLSLPQQLLPDCIHFSCCSPIASASAAAPRLQPLQLLLPEVVSLQFLLSICIRVQTQPFWEVLAPALCSQYSLQSSRFRGCSKVHILVPPPKSHFHYNHTKGISSHQGR